MNDTYSIHSKLLDILVETSKQQELTALVELMMRKYKTLEAYVACGEACYKSGMVEKARHVMQRGIVVLEKKERELNENNSLHGPCYVDRILLIACWKSCSYDIEMKKRLCI